MKACTKCGETKPLTEFYCRPSRRKAPESWCKGCYREKHRSWCTANPEKKAASNRAWNAANPDKNRASKRKWAAANAAKINAKTTRRQAAKLQAAPSWANLFFIEEAYDLARRRTKTTGIRWEVDHIVPLQSEQVCGLHVEHNLRVIPKTENQAKGNRHWPDMP